MADITALRQAIATNIAGLALPELGGAEMPVTWYMPAQLQPPCIYVAPADSTYDLAMNRGLDQLAFTVTALVPLTLDQGMQQILDRLLASSGTRSVKARIETDRTLGGLADGLIVRSVTGYRQYVFDGRPPYLGAEWSVDVNATGT